MQKNICIKLGINGRKNELDVNETMEGEDGVLGTRIKDCIARKRGR